MLSIEAAVEQRESELCEEWEEKYVEAPCYKCSLPLPEGEDFHHCKYCTYEE